MTRYKRYVASLDALLNSIKWGNRIGAASKTIKKSLDGDASVQLRNLVPLKKLRKYGAFFTSRELGKRTIKPIAKQHSRRGIVSDPTCGAGDLLLRWAESLRVNRSLEKTMIDWGSRIHGLDLHKEFIDASKRRLVLLAISMGAKGSGTALDLSKTFPYIKQGSVFEANWAPPRKSAIILNPPFSSIVAPNSCAWANGKVSLASLIFAHCIEKCHHGQRITAILPDVLRSGSRYAAWRQHIKNLFTIDKIEIVGKFDRHTDVDVFILRGKVGLKSKKSVAWNSLICSKTFPTLGDFFKVRVGPLVAYREPKKGSYFPFLTASDLKNRKVTTSTTSIVRKRRYSGPVLKPPFVAVQRTSSPSDLSRPVSTIVVGKTAVAVENHVITLTPTDGTLKTCYLALKSLRNSEAKAWLNQRIRCRHLTVGSMREMPLWKCQK